jgi:hypothetical protein
MNSTTKWWAAASASALVITGVGYAAVPAHAEPHGSDVTVDDRDYPVCDEEDCSDQPGQVGVWYDPDTGEAWLSTGPDYSLHVDQAFEPATR